MLSPLYIAEAAPSHIRGRLVSLNQLAIVTGFFVVYFVNLYISGLGNEAWNIEYGWRWMFAASVVPSFLFFVLLLLVPESPRWLTQQNKKPEALAVLSKVGGSAYAQEEVRQIVESIENDEEKSGTFGQLFQQPHLRLALLIACALAVLQQVTGINAIMYYAPQIFEKTGAGTDAAMFSTLLVGAVNLAFTFVALWLIDRLGRKALLLAGAVGMALSLLGVGLAFALNMTAGSWILICILGFVASFAASMGPVVWVVISEIFPTRIRGRAMSVATMVLWIATFAVSQTFPMMLAAFGPASTFWTYMGMSFATVLFVQLFVPETKDLPLEKIEQLLMDLTRKLGWTA
jgi:SP family arabinose:H+ symporter-like MFS transporter